MDRHSHMMYQIQQICMSLVRAQVATLVNLYFQKNVLLQRDIVSDQGKGGKRAIRVYPPWDKPTSNQAQKTQQWQLEYFLEVPFTEPLNCDQARVLMINHYNHL